MCLGFCGDSVVAKMPLKQTPKAKGQVEVVEPFVRGRKAVQEFYDELASVCDLPVDELKKILEGLKKAAVRDLRNNGSFKIHGLVSFSVKAFPGTPESKGVCLGKEFVRREKPGKKKVVCKADQAMSDKVVC